MGIKVVSSSVAADTRYVYLNNPKIDPTPLIQTLTPRPWVEVAERKRGAPSKVGTNGVRVVVSPQYSDAQIESWLTKAVESFKRELQNA